jgi:hypothetical protein
MGTTTERKRLGIRLRRKYLDGASIRALARETGRSPGYVRRLLVESGTRIRSGEPWPVVRERLIREGVLIPALRPKGEPPPPVIPLVEGTSLSAYVIAMRRGCDCVL